MRRNRTAVAVMLILSVPGLLLPGCGGGDRTANAAADFDSLAAEAVDLYIRIHPLRSSRLGIARADSLLFTFSSGEVSDALDGIESLLSSVSGIPTAGLDRRRLEDSILLVDWLQGERYALGPGGTVYDNPVLLAWMIEEAICGIPAREGEPGPREADAWEARLGRVPLLAGEGPGLISKPGPPHLARALDILDGVLSRIPLLERRALSRYGRPAENLEMAAGSAASLRRAIAGMLEGQAGGSVIMGREALTTAIKYSEHLDLDTEELAREAEKVLARLQSQSYGEGFAGKERAESADPDTLLAESWKRAGPVTGFGGARREVPGIVRYEPVYEPMELPVNPYLTVPVVPEEPVRAVFVRGPGGRCEPRVVVPEGRRAESVDIVYGILMSALEAGGPLGVLCSNDRATRWILSPATWELGWRNIVRAEMPGMLPAHRFAVSFETNRRERQALARMIATFRIHSGVFTTESAARFLSETAGIGREAAEEAAVAASISPAAAFEGAAMMISDGILRRATMEGGVRSPRRRVLKLLEENAGLPLPMISRLVESQQ